jgi:hypothetical protein
MAQDKRGRPPEPPVDEVLNELAAEDSAGQAAGPTSRNDVGDTKRAAAKATGLMGATKKLDPDLRMEHINEDRPKSGSKAGLHSFAEVSPEKGGDAHLEVSNAEIAESVTTTAHKSPARRSAQTDAATGPDHGGIGPGERARVPAPGAAVTAPKGELVRGHPTATQAGGRSQSSTGDEKPPKRSARAGTGQVERPLAKGGSEERD